jgi:catechol 2,3-dioxygenase-like lactoylglutathione lyase family enzyme
MPARAIHHVDLAVSDVERSLAFYLAVLGPLGLHESECYPTYRGTEEVFTSAMASVAEDQDGMELPATGVPRGRRARGGGGNRSHRIQSRTQPQRS